MVITAAEEHTDCTDNTDVNGDYISRLMLILCIICSEEPILNGPDFDKKRFTGPLSSLMMNILTAIT